MDEWSIKLAIHIQQPEEEDHEVWLKHQKASKWTFELRLFCYTKLSSFLYIGELHFFTGLMLVLSSQLHFKYTLCVWINMDWILIVMIWSCKDKMQQEKQANTPSLIHRTRQRPKLQHIFISTLNNEMSAFRGNHYGIFNGLEAFLSASASSPQGHSVFLPPHCWIYTCRCYLLALK